MKLWKKILIIIIEALLMGYISFSVFSGYYDGYKWILKNKYYYSRDLILSEDLDVLIETGERVSIKKHEVIHSCAVSRDGFIIDALYEPEPGKCLYIEEGISLESFSDRDSIKTDLKQLIEEKENYLNKAKRAMVIEYCQCFLVCLVLAIIIMWVSRGVFNIHLGFIILLVIVSAAVFYIVGLGGFDHPLRKIDDVSNP